MANVDDNYNYPTTNDIKPYVSVGPTEELSITVHKDTFDSGFMIFTIIFGLGLIIIVGVVIFFAYQQTKLPPLPPPLKLTKPDPVIHSNIGGVASSTSIIQNNILDELSVNNKQICESYPNTIWTGIKCECKPPFFGPTCSREKHNNKYYAVGIPDTGSLGITILNEIVSDGKSFNDNGVDNSCSDLCNKSEQCVGFIYNSNANINGSGICTLLTDNVIVPNGFGISYSPEIDSTLYMRSSDDLQFEGRIFLGEFIGVFPPRYWLISETPYYKQIYVNEITTLKFAPTYTKIYGDYVGIYCLFPFSFNDVNLILKRGETSECYIHYPKTKINLPPDWKYRKPLYVVYV